MQKTIKLRIPSLRYNYNKLQAFKGYNLTGFDTGIYAENRHYSQVLNICITPGSLKSVFPSPPFTPHLTKHRKSCVSFLSL
jgi:hypothetical protein